MNQGIIFKMARKGPALTENAKIVLESRYLLKNESGRVIETPEQLFDRVALSVAEPEGRQRTKWAEKFKEMMIRLRFIPNSPTLMNAGRKNGQLSACFVLPIRDSLDSIFDTLKAAAMIHQSGGGTGFSFSQIRPRGSLVRSTHGVASGPVSFIRIYDISTETIKQGGARRGANMAILRVDHPDILEFIDSKTDFKSITNFNISVGVTDEFMDAVSKKEDYALIDPRTGEEVRMVNAAEVFDRIAQSAWVCGDPGLVFLDRVNLFNPTPQEGPMESTNPCGEQPLLPYESCNLGSLNLGTYLKKSGFDWDLFRQDIHHAVRFLDNVIDINYYPIRECARITQHNRKIGLGVMGFADLLLLQGLPYGSSEARRQGELVMSFLDREAKFASSLLAKERGEFRNWRGSLWQRLGYSPLRNSTVSTVAPTGTISMIAGASSGIEPIYSGILVRNVLSGARLVEVHPAVGKLLAERGITGGISEMRVAKELGAVWSPSHTISVEDHVRMQAVFQRHSDSAVSKTVNLPENATVASIAQAYLMAYEEGCKGITVYRDKSRPGQVLEVAPESQDQCPAC